MVATKTNRQMALNEYKRKRDFRRTGEPKPRLGKPHRKPVFVVQEQTNSRAQKTRVKGRHKPIRRRAPAADIANKQPKRFDFTHVDKVIYPDAGVVKADVIEFY